MSCLEFITTRLLVGCCCCASEDSESGEGGKKSMALAPKFQFFSSTGAAPPAAAAGSPERTPGSAPPSSPLRWPSTRLSTSRPLSPAPSYIVNLATSDQAAVQSERRDLTITVGVKVIPHPDKILKGGEDAYFISNHNGGVLGVADGVSGWAAENVDPALFSKELMAHALAAVGTEEVHDDPRLLLAKAHASTASVGAATAIVAILDKKGILRVANLGDCGLRILRNGKVIYATSPQQHYFDCPYQLSSENAQTAADAAVYELGVMEGDTIVMGSDGLFDNVYDYDIEATVKVFGGSDEDAASRTALALASLACKHAKDRNYDSPYAKEAILQGHDLPWWKKFFGGLRIGGKVDDITVVVAHILNAPVSSENSAPPVKLDSSSDRMKAEETLT